MYMKFTKGNSYIHHFIYLSTGRRTVKVFKSEKKLKMPALQSSVEGQLFKMVTSK